MTGPFEEAREEYEQRDWPIFPLPAHSKSPPPTGTTGRAAAETAAVYRGQTPTGANLGARCPAGVIGIDVDHYPPKAGGTTIKLWQEEKGLHHEHTIVSTSRDLPSGIYWYQVPVGLEFASPCLDVDIIQPHHRYAVLPPSTVEDRTYIWIDERTGEILESPPYVDELPWLPPEWVEELVIEPEQTTERQPVAWEATDNSTTHPAVERALASMTVDKGGRHESALGPLLTLTRLESEGYPGATAALAAAKARFGRWLGEDRDGEAEWDRMAAGARRKVAASESTIPPYRPPASLMDRVLPEKPDYGEIVEVEQDPVKVLEGRLLYGADIFDLPDPDRMVGDWLDRGMTWAMIGKQSSAKTFFALSMGLSVATGKPWLGQEIHHQGKVLYVAAEGAYTLGKRLRAWLLLNGLDREDVRDFIVYPTNFDLLRLSGLETTGNDPLSGSDALELLCHELQPAMVVLDTLNRSMPSGDENASADMGTAFEVVDRIRKNTDASVGMIHHTGVGDDSRSRGHSSLEGNIDVKFLSKDVGGTFKLSSEKQKTREIGAVIHAKLKDDSGGPVLVPASAPEFDSPFSDPRVTEAKMSLLRAMRLHASKTLTKAEWCSRVVGTPRTIGIGFEELVEVGYFVDVGTGFEVDESRLP